MRGSDRRLPVCDRLPEEHPNEAMRPLPQATHQEGFSDHSKEGHRGHQASLGQRPACGSGFLQRRFGWYGSA